MLEQALTMLGHARRPHLPSSKDRRDTAALLFGVVRVV